jgi:peptide/nickel transport system permease protein
VIGTLIGVYVGFIAGYYGGWRDTFFRNFMDVFLVIPSLPLLIVIASFLRRSDIWIIILVLIPFSWASSARQVRGQTLSLKRRDFIYMARLSGMTGGEIILWEILPHMSLWIVSNFANSVLSAMMAEAGIELLGLGPAHTITLGMILYWAQYHSALFAGLWWWWTPPLAMLVLIFMSLFLIHLGFDEIINLRRGE